MIVLADVAILFRFLQEIHPVAADMAHGDTGVLGIAMRDLDQLLAALLVHLRQRHADEGTLRRWLESEIGLADCFLDDLHLPGG